MTKRWHHKAAFKARVALEGSEERTDGYGIHAQARTFGFQDGFLLLVFFFLCAMIPAYLLGRLRK